jgi:hypothetical protein
VTYYQSRIDAINDIRSRIKHVDPENINLDDIRDTLGYIISDLEVLASLKRPDSFKLTRVSEDGMLMTKVEIQMMLDEAGAEDMIRKLWLEEN